MEVDAEVEAVVGFETVVVSVLKVSYGACIVVGCMGLFLIIVGVERAAVACGIYPCGREVDALVQLVACGDVYVVTAVILGMEGTPTVDDVSFAVKLSHGLRPGIGYPSGKLAYGALCHELESIRPSVTHCYLVFPRGRSSHEGGALSIFEQIVQVLVVAFGREVAQSLKLVVDASGHLVRMFGVYVLGDRHPKVGRETDIAV